MRLQNDVNDSVALQHASCYTYKVLASHTFVRKSMLLVQSVDRKSLAWKTIAKFMVTVLSLALTAVETPKSNCYYTNATNNNNTIPYRRAAIARAHKIPISLLVYITRSIALRLTLFNQHNYVSIQLQPRSACGRSK